MDAALLLAALCARAGDRVDFLAYDRTVRAQVTGGGRGDLLPGLVTAMAPCSPSSWRPTPTGWWPPCCPGCGGAAWWSC